MLSGLNHFCILLFVEEQNIKLVREHSSLKHLYHVIFSPYMRVVVHGVDMYSHWRVTWKSDAHYGSGFTHRPAD